jgi:hypothetical protein
MCIITKASTKTKTKKCHPCNFKSCLSRVSVRTFIDSGKQGRCVPKMAGLPKRTLLSLIFPRCRQYIMMLNSQKLLMKGCMIIHYNCYSDNSAFFGGSAIFRTTTSFVYQNQNSASTGKTLVKELVYYPAKIHWPTMPHSISNANGGSRKSSIFAITYGIKNVPKFVKNNVNADKIMSSLNRVGN